MEEHLLDSTHTCVCQLKICIVHMVCYQLKKLEKVGHRFNPGAIMFVR